MRINNCMINIKNVIYRWLIEKPRLDAFQRFIRRSVDRDYCKMVAERDPLTVHCIAYGDENRGKPIFYIKLGNKNHGFCALLRTTIVNLLYCDDLGLQPAIYWNPNIAYADKGRKESNPYEYYFEQPVISIEDVYKSCSVYLANENHSDESFFYGTNKSKEQYLLSNDVLEQMAQVTRKYIKVKQEILADTSAKFDAIVQNRSVLGVHFRGTDFFMNYNNHPIGVTCEEYFSEIDRLLQEKQYERIFLATDDKNALDLFRQKYGEKLLFYPEVERGTEKRSVAFSNNDRRLHYYWLGREVLQDMLSLAKCDGYVGSMSNVSICAMVFNKAFEKGFEDIYIFNKGINHNRNNFYRT